MVIPVSARDERLEIRRRDAVPPVPVFAIQVSAGINWGSFFKRSGEFYE
jgi:hypothetical protein